MTTLQFRDILRLGIPQFTGGVSSTTMRKQLIPDAVQRGIIIIKAKLARAVAISVAADGWSQGGPSKKHFMGMLVSAAIPGVHGMELRKFCIHFGETPVVSSTGDFQGELYKSVLQLWGVRPEQLVAITTDGASDAKKSATELVSRMCGVTSDMTSMVCFAHATSLVISDCHDVVESLFARLSDAGKAYNGSNVMHLAAETFVTAEEGEPGHDDVTVFPNPACLTA